MPTWADVFGQRPALLVQGWTANHDYSADLVAAYPAWGTGAGGDIIQFLSPDGFTDIFLGEVNGSNTDAMEPDWASAPNQGDSVPDGGTTDSWWNVGPLSGFPAILQWATDTQYIEYSGGAGGPWVAGVTSSLKDGHVYVNYPGTGARIDTTGESEPSFPTDGNFVGDDNGYWLDLGEINFASTRISVGFSDGPLTAYPAWTSLDETDNLISRYTITRGRTDTFDRTGTGTAQIDFADTQGILDPTNTSGPYYNAGKFIDGKQAAIALQNPCTSEWTTIFQGLIDDVEQEVDPSQHVAFGQISLVDGLDYLANVELHTGDSQGSPPNAGDIYFTTDAQVKDRIDYVLGRVDWPAEKTITFTGNVQLQAHAYSPSTPALNPIDDAADAEFPGIANRYCDKENNFVFHGRLARFNAESDPEFGIQVWKAGDGAAILSNSSYAQIRGLAFGRPRSALVNDALFTPQGVADADIDSCHVTDATSITNYGRHSKSAQDLLILHDNLTGNNAVDQCHEFAAYWVAARKDPKTRITKIQFKSLAPTDPRASRVWALMCGVEISDIIQLKTGTVEGGFVDSKHFVEGIQYDIAPANEDFDNVTLTLSVTPQDDFDYAWA